MNTMDQFGYVALTCMYMSNQKSKEFSKTNVPVYVAGSNLPQYPAAGPFTQLIYKNINVPVYTTLKGVSEMFII